jgi:4-amino-4-deoxy-L-arabinose transferase-like glycosyltransferase
MKKQSIFIIVIAIIFTIVYVYAFDSKLDLNGDNANYLRLAKNLSQGLGYSNITANGVAPTNFYPPGYPAFLSLFMMLGINSLVFFKVLNGIFLFLSLWGMYYLVNKLTGKTYLAFVVAILTLLSPQLIHFSNIAMSEMLYLFTTVVCFLSLYQYAQKNSDTFWKSPYFYIAIVSAAASFYIRTVGSTVIFALLVFFLFRKEWFASIAAVGGIVLLNLPWSIRNSLAGLESRYMGTIMTVNPWRPEEGSISSVGELIDKMIANFDEIVIKGIKEILFPFVEIDYQVPSGFLAIVIGLLILAVLFYGAWNLDKMKWFFVAYLVSCIGLLLLWHGGNGSRYLVTIAPVLFVLFYLGIYKLLCLLLKGKQKLATALPFAFLVMVFFMLPPLQMQAKRLKNPIIRLMKTILR